MSFDDQYENDPRRKKKTFHSGLPHPNIKIPTDNPEAMAAIAGIAVIAGVVFLLFLVIKSCVG